MPKSITIRDIPDDVYEKIKKQAELHHRSINSEVIVYLKMLAQSNRRDPDQVITHAKKLKQKAKGTLSMEEIQQAIDEGRP
ncbi:FitA-like ribbon-helix-helix domain-containing protein [Rhodohalobacter halophilus]|uniref:FitA-like ribbon-helix-helix domain-containing protein n=1 Tax=Rhodohalobacter halophilus TaxID=1812810 RepID=UPI00083FB427|nr:Arc family DNA-binding protein [Rhodohalobacter halophilus]